MGLPPSNSKFPGCLPVSIHKEDILGLYGHQKLSMTEYVVSHKADGIRYFLVFYLSGEEPRCILVSRDGNTIQIPVQGFDWLFQGTIFDVELTMTPKGYLILIFDTLCLGGDTCLDIYYPVRIELAKMTLFKLRVLFPGPCGIPLTPPIPGAYSTAYPSTCFQIGEYENSALYVTTKDIYYPQALIFLAQSPGFLTDGFIWTSTTSKYTPFRSSLLTVLKWKPPSQITLDFLISNKQPDSVRCAELPTQYSSPYGDWTLYSKYGDDLVYISKIDTPVPVIGIYECDWTGKWGVVKYRNDKKHPNLLNTVLHTLRNIDEDISLLDLLGGLEPYSSPTSQ
jgi:hypothetical protein